MKRIKIGAGFTVFILFFGIALMDAITTFNWPRMIFWVVMGAAFLAADNLKEKKQS